MLYHLHMPSYILRTFTEYPKIKSHKTKIATIRYTNDCDFYFVLEAGLRKLYHITFILKYIHLFISILQYTKD